MMKRSFAAAAAALLSLASLPPALGDEGISIHGSGTTNPSKCLWLLNQQFMERSKIPIRLTYRAVGSSTGQKEFLGVNNTGTNMYVPYNDFGAGDIPISTANYDAFTQTTGKEMLHLPFVLGAISIFHNIPNVPEGNNGLNLTSCAIAKIFKREIIYWDHDEIVEMNPNLKKMLPSENYPIHIARRVYGSSSTASITQYLRTSCPEEWPENLVGKVIDWPEKSEECEGSGGMTKCLKEIPGAIGYIDSGHGHDVGLKEIELRNFHGTYLSSRRASVEGGIGAAAGEIPINANEDFGSVSLLNRPGIYTWPIVAMSYVYVRTDLSFMKNPDKKSLLVAYLRNLYDPDSINQCMQFGFTPVPENVRTVGLEGIDMIQLDAESDEWIIEKDTLPGIGQGDYVISHKRRTYAEYERTSNQDDLIDAMERIAYLERLLTGTSEGEAERVESQAKTTTEYRLYTSDDARQLTAALALAAISFALWCIAILFFLAKKVCGI